MTMQVKCPTCDKEVAWTKESLHRPFCSHRCRLIDLGQWADESHRIPGEPDAADEDVVDNPHGNPRTGL